METSSAVGDVDLVHLTLHEIVSDGLMALVVAVFYTADLQFGWSAAAVGSVLVTLSSGAPGSVPSSPISSSASSGGSRSTSPVSTRR